MSEDTKQKDLRFIGKLRTLQSDYGEFYKIYVDNTSDKNHDGTPNNYYKGVLLWADVNGKTYQVKQMSMIVPKKGMNQALLDKGYTHLITINLDDGYEVTVLG